MIWSPRSIDEATVPRANSVTDHPVWVIAGRDREILAEAREYCEGDPVERHYFSTKTST